MMTAHSTGTAGIGRGNTEGSHGAAAGRALTATATFTAIAHVLRSAAPFLGDDDKGTVLKQVVSMTVDSACPVAVAEDLLEALVALADKDPAKILEVYASRLCFYCDSQSDPSMQDQIAEVEGMIRAVEYFTRVLFTGGESDRCAQFLYADLSSGSLGSTPFPSRLSEEELNELLCGRKNFPHVAQLVNACLASRLGSVRRFAYETLSNVSLFAKAHRGPKAFDMLLRLRLRGKEKDPRLVALLAALVWEVVFVDEELQDHRLVGSGTPGSYGLLDDLFADSVDVRLVALHSVGRLLFHAWIPAGGHAEEQRQGATGGPNGQRLDSREEDGGDTPPHSEGEEPEIFPRGSRASRGAGGGSIAGDTRPADAVVAACAEQAVLRLSLILHESSRRFNTRVRATSRSLAKTLHSRRRDARHLLARSALLVVDHGLANGSLDGLRDRFPPHTRLLSSGGGGASRGGGGGASGNGQGLGSPTMSMSSHDAHDERDFGGWRDSAAVGVNYAGGKVRQSHLSDLSRSVEGTGDSGGFCDDGRRWSQAGVGREEDDRVKPENGAGSGERASERQQQRRLGRDALQYAAAVHFLVAMLSVEDQASVIAAVESRLEDYFEAGDAFWGGDWLTGEDGNGMGSCNVDPRAATAWLVGGVDARQSLLGEDWA